MTFSWIYYAIFFTQETNICNEIKNLSWDYIDVSKLVLFLAVSTIKFAMAMLAIKITHDIWD